MEIKDKKIRLDGYTIEINYSCPTKNNRIELLDLLSTNSYYNSNIVRCVEFIRTIFDGIYEQSLNIAFKYDNDQEEVVSYIDYKLSSYSIKDKQGNLAVSIAYSNGKFVCINENSAQDEMREFIKRLLILQNNNGITINKFDKDLITTYHSTYQMVPDFRKPDTKDQIQQVAYDSGICNNYFTVTIKGKKYNLQVNEETLKLQVLTERQLKKVISKKGI